MMSSGMIKQVQFVQNLFFCLDIESLNGIFQGQSAALSVGAEASHAKILDERTDVRPSRYGLDPGFLAKKSLFVHLRRGRVPNPEMMMMINKKMIALSSTDTFPRRQSNCKRSGFVSAI